MDEEMNDQWLAGFIDGFETAKRQKQYLKVLNFVRR
jgi:hypothetical protein